MRAYGWRRDDLDPRDLKFAAVHHPHLAELPDRVSLADRMPPVFDQKQEASCTANALLAAFGFLHPGFIGSRQFVYYNERLIEGTVASDGGAQIRDGIKVLASLGAPPESLWPYDAAHFAAPPTPEVNAEAAKHKITSYSRLTSEDDMRQCLAAGFPFVIGFAVFSSFLAPEVARTGLVPLPDYDEQLVSGHAVCVIGYDRNSPLGDGWLVRNSLGESFGLHGNFWMPRGYLTHPDLASDAWTQRA